MHKNKFNNFKTFAKINPRTIDMGESELLLNEDTAGRLRQYNRQRIDTRPGRQLIAYEDEINGFGPDIYDEDEEEDEEEQKMTKYELIMALKGLKKKPERKSWVKSITNYISENSGKLLLGAGALAVGGGLGYMLGNSALAGLGAAATGASAIIDDAAEKAGKVMSKVGQVASTTGHAVNTARALTKGMTPNNFQTRYAYEMDMERTNDALSREVKGLELEKMIRKDNEKNLEEEKKARKLGHRGSGQREKIANYANLSNMGLLKTWSEMGCATSWGTYLFGKGTKCNILDEELEKRSNLPRGNLAATSSRELGIIRNNLQNKKIQLPNWLKIN
jgi:hypothetical protein